MIKDSLLENSSISGAGDIAPNDSSQTYEELSKEFERLYPSVNRAIQLIGIMYTRLTLVDKLTHKEAKAKIYEDHKHLPGFSTRNIRRSITSLDNPNIPHRKIRPTWPNSGITEENRSGDELDSSGEMLPATNDDHSLTSNQDSIPNELIIIPDNVGRDG